MGLSGYDRILIVKMCQWAKIKYWFFVPKIIIIGLDLFELFEHIKWLRFFETQCVIICLT